MAKIATFFANFPVNKHPSTSEVIRRYRSTYERCNLLPLVTSSIGDSEFIIHFQEAYAGLFPNCYNKQGIQSNLPSYTPMNQGTICAKVYPEGIQPMKGNNCGLIPTVLMRNRPFHFSSCLTSFNRWLLAVTSYHGCCKVVIFTDKAKSCIKC